MNHEQRLAGWLNTTMTNTEAKAFAAPAPKVEKRQRTRVTNRAQMRRAIIHGLVRRRK